LLAFAASAFALGAFAALDPVDPLLRTAGSFTSVVLDGNAYSMPAPVLSDEALKRFMLGRAQFHERWGVIPEPSLTWGLGPTFNENRCSTCHEGNGRARAPKDERFAEKGFLVRLSIAGRDEVGGPKPHPVYGDQLQNRGIPDTPAEGQAIVTYREIPVTFADGEAVTLREPSIEFRLYYDPLDDTTMHSARIAPAMIGLGLLEAVPDEELLRIAARQPASLRGRPNIVWDHEAQRRATGRFGWKASQPTMQQQVAAAMIGDIGATTAIFPDENCPLDQFRCRNAPSALRCVRKGACENQEPPEALPLRIENIAFYLRAIAVPVRRNADDPVVKRGEALFETAQCSACHVPSMKTGPDAAFAPARNQTIHAYTDLLLHDMGEGLADHREDFEASGREWRTPPLWGIGLLQTVNGHTELLHDGRARNVTEAILWHGGQAEGAREAFRAMPKAERDALVRFVESL
jgi:CxxC motif-containing protein (DUF1111 family)